MVLGVIDAAFLDDVKADLAAAHAPGYTLMPVLEGAGHTGIHAGNRVHPGSLVALWVMGDDDEVHRLLDMLVARRDARHDSVTRFVVVPVERVA